MLRGGICGALPVNANPSSNLRILVAEDESLIALNLEMTLEQFGWKVIGPIWRVRDIVEAIREHRPDGALLDVNLRGQQVFDVLAEVMDLGVPIVLTSGYDDQTSFPAAFRGLPRIAKPFNEAELHRVCCRTMAPSRLV
jgi:two-component SAPR family response regulator